MKKGKTSTGFEYAIPMEKVDDWDMFNKLVLIDKGDYSVLPEVVEEIFEPKDLEALKKHVKEIHGRVSLTGMMAEIREILSGDEDSKN